MEYLFQEEFRPGRERGLVALSRRMRLKATRAAGGAGMATTADREGSPERPVGKMSFCLAKALWPKKKKKRKGKLNFVKNCGIMFEYE
ncbi:MAG: hypothetical protein K6E78_08175 [Treponema sp.]|nr:hypothetical protein [Treponema sp.]